MGKLTDLHDKEKGKKICLKCKKEKDISDFSRDKGFSSGRGSRCKVCKRISGRNYKKTRTEWNKLHRDRITKAINEYRARNKDKAEAWKIFHNAIASGTIVRQPCMICGKENAHGHHDDYSKPLAVKWVCREHYEQIHTGEI